MDVHARDGSHLPRSAGQPDELGQVVQGTPARCLIVFVVTSPRYCTLVYVQADRVQADCICPSWLFLSKTDVLIQAGCFCPRLMYSSKLVVSVCKLIAYGQARCISSSCYLIQ